jgi:hypothetical protein
MERRAISEGWAQRGDMRAPANSGPPPAPFESDRRPAPSLVAMLDEMGEQHSL